MNTCFKILILLCLVAPAADLFGEQACNCQKKWRHWHLDFENIGGRVCVSLAACPPGRYTKNPMSLRIGDQSDTTWDCERFNLAPGQLCGGSLN